MVETVLGMTDLQIKLVTAVGQLALATTVAYVAWRQWRTARNKLKADLYDRRFALYKEFRTRVESVLMQQDSYAVGEVMATAVEMRWLFGNTVADHVENIVLPRLESYMTARDAVKRPDPDADTRMLQTAYLESMEAAFQSLHHSLDLLTPQLTLSH